VEAVGYIGRALAHSATDSLIFYIMQSIFTLLPPILFAASIYMVLSRIIRAAGGEEYSLIGLGKLTKIFVWGDVVSFVIQGNGASLMAIGNSLSSMAQWIVIGGLALQIAMFGLFMITAVVFQLRYERHSVKVAVYSYTGWKQSLYMLYAVSTLVMIRSIFRVFEFILGTGGYPMTHEWTLYVFDSTLMFGVMVIFYLYYPSNLVVPAGMERIDSTMELGIPEGYESQHR
jgi:hypothetical protein